MAEPLCCRFSELLKFDVSICGTQLSRSSNLEKYQSVPLPRLASPTSGFRCAHSIASDSVGLCGNDNLSFELRQHARTQWTGDASIWHGNSEVQDPASLCTFTLQNAASSSSIVRVGASEKYDKDSARDTSTSTVSARVTKDIKDASDIHMSPITGTMEFIVSDTHNIQPVSTSQMQSARASFDSDASADELLLHFTCLISALRNDDGTSIAMPSVKVPYLSSILQKVKPSRKVKEFFHWMKANCSGLDVHGLVFGELGKRQEWSLLDNLLRDEVDISEGKANCEVFNRVFEVCVTQDASVWASKWFSFMMQEGAQPDSTTFELLIPLFKRHMMVEDTDFAFQHMIGAGVKCLAASSAMIMLYIQVGQLKKAVHIYFNLKETSKEPLEKIFISELNFHKRCGNVKQAEELVNFMQVCGVRFDLFIYNTMITMNGKAGEFSRAKEWFFSIEKDGLHPNEATYRSIIGACGRAGSLYDALRFYDRMVGLNFSPSLVNYNSLIHLHRKIDNEGRIVALLSDMKSAGCRPDSATFNSVLKVYERYGRLVNLPEALGLLREAGWEPNDSCYGLLIRAFIRFNMVDEAMEIFKKLCTAAKLEEIMCHNLICMCKSAGRYDEAIYVFHAMQEVASVAPSLRTSCAVIDVYSLKGAIKEGEALYKKLRSKQELDAAVYNVALNLYGKAGHLDSLTEVLREVLQEKNLKPNMDLFLCMLKMCTKYELRKEAVELYWRIVNCEMVWIHHLYIEVVHCCGRLLPVEEILKVFNAMKAAKTPIDGATSNLLLDIFAKAGLLEEAECIFRLAQRQGVYNCITFSTMLGAYGRQKKFDQMEFILNEMLKQGYKECVEAYNAMIDAYGGSGMINTMENTLERMKMTGCEPNLTTFNILIKVYGQEGLIKDLQRVPEKIRRSGLKLDRNSFNSLIHAHGSANMLGESLEYYQEMQKAGFEPDLITYTCLMAVLRAQGYRNDAARLSNWINTGGLE
ncbi:hypothetical protein L7F22_057398 [Adiantum nelumboides]|nr:hypothetical protein [Adiantum nelumboides]